MGNKSRTQKKLNKHIVKQCQKLLDHLKYYNNLAPFPVYDTEYVDEVENFIKMMKKENKIDYDDLPVASCKYCKSLHITTDDADNNICMRCGSINDIVIHEDIHKYIEDTDDK